MEAGELYCPICARTLEARNKEDVDSKQSDAYVYVHDDIEHTDHEIMALKYPIQ